jgi:membrane protease YdiL (CAAX protease family)
VPLRLGLVLTLLLLAAFHVVRRHRSPLVAGPAFAVLVLLVARSTGRSWTRIGLSGRGWGWALAAIAATALVYAAALAIPVTRRLFRDSRYQRDAVRTALIAVPLATVAVEEAAFRGALWPIAWATPVLFGLWHVLPGSRTNAAVAGRWAPVATFAFTTAAGVVFALLRHFSGGLLAPFALHWAINGLGVLAQALALRWSRADPE